MSNTTKTNKIQEVRISEVREYRDEQGVLVTEEVL